MEDQHKEVWIAAYCATLSRLMGPGKSESKDMFRECGVCANRAVEAFKDKWERPVVAPTTK